jgi:hypothetical protein
MSVYRTNGREGRGMFSGNSFLSLLYLSLSENAVKPLLI